MDCVQCLQMVSSLYHTKTKSNGTLLKVKLPSKFKAAVIYWARYIIVKIEQERTTQVSEVRGRTT